MASRNKPEQANNFLNMVFELQEPLNSYNRALMTPNRILKKLCLPKTSYYIQNKFEKFIIIPKKIFDEET